MSDVKIKVKGIQYTEDNTPLVTELYSEGTFYMENSNFCFEYNESELNGMKGSVSKLVTNREKNVSLIRTGFQNSTVMVFEEGKNLKSNYNTDFGSFSISIKTIKVICNISDNGTGNVYLEYILSFGTEVKSKNKLEITIS